MSFQKSQPEQIVERRSAEPAPFKLILLDRLPERRFRETMEKGQLRPTVGGAQHAIVGKGIRLTVDKFAERQLWLLGVDEASLNESANGVHQSRRKAVAGKAIGGYEKAQRRRQRTKRFNAARPDFRGDAQRRLFPKRRRPIQIALLSKLLEGTIQLRITGHRCSDFVSVHAAALRNPITCSTTRSCSASVMR